MKRIKLLFLLQALMMLCGIARPVDIIIGTGTSGSSLVPFTNAYPYGITQTVYTAEEIGQGGEIMAIAYNVVTATTFNMNSVKIYMGHKSSNAFSSSLDYMPTSKLTLVYSGRPTMGNANGWEMINLTTPFYYDGESNLVVVVCRSSGSSINMQSNLQYSLSLVNNSCLYRTNYSSSNSACSDISNTSFAYNLSNYRADIKLTMENTTPDFIVSGIAYQKNNDNEVQVVANSYTGIVRIPSSVTFDGKEYTVKEIGKNAFKDCSSLSFVFLDEGLKTIGDNAFHGCLALASISIPNSVTNIGIDAFSGCSNLKEVKVDGTIVEKDYTSSNNLSTIFGTQLNKLEVGANAKKIGRYAFYNMFLNSSSAHVTIGGGVTSIGVGAFSNCYGLTRAEFASIESLCKISFGEVSSNPLYYAKHLFIGGTEIINLVIPNNVTAIEKYAFANCANVSSVSIPSSISSIGTGAFYGCMGLTKAEFASIESLCNISMGPDAANPLLWAKHLYIEGDEIMDLVIPNSVGSIGNYTFSGCAGLTSVSIPSSVTSIGAEAFSGCSSLSFVSIPSSVVVIGNYAFSDCSSLSSINIPNGMTSIGDCAFADCNHLASISIPSSLTSFGKNVFWHCTALNDVYVHYVTPPSIDNTVFSKYGTLHVNKLMESNYSSLDNWKNFNIVDDVEYQTVTGITFGQSNYKVTVGNLGQLSCTVSPADALLKDVIWSTEDNDKIFVDANTGQFIGLSHGSAIVKATSIDYNEFSASVQVLIVNEESISLSQSSLDLRIDHTTTLVATQVTNTGSDKPVTWTSSNTSVATVSNGVVTGVSEGTAVITASIEGGASATCTVNVSVLRATLADGSVSNYSNPTTDDYDQITYTRNFSNTKWQSLYVPFTMTYEDWKEDFDVAYINSVRQYDNDGDGAVDETIMDVIQIMGGELYPNMPYLIRAKSTGEKTITLNDATLYKTEENSIECSTMLSTFTFTGTYSTISAATLQANGYYAMGGGGLIMTNGTSSLKPFRWYLDITSRSPMYNTSVHNPSRIGIHVIGEEDGMETRIYEVAREEELDAQIFNLNGQKMGSMENLAPGVYVKNGKKFIVK